MDKTAREIRELLEEAVPEADHPANGTQIHFHGTVVLLASPELIDTLKALLDLLP